jgi:hypothetical protein
MTFNEWSKARLADGRKRLTSRFVPKEDECVVDVVGPLPWGFIRDFLYRDEGAESPEELQTVIEDIHGRHIEDDEVFYVHVIDSSLVNLT